MPQLYEQLLIIPRIDFTNEDALMRRPLRFQERYYSERDRTLEIQCRRFHAEIRGGHAEAAKKIFEDTMEWFKRDTISGLILLSYEQKLPFIEQDQLTAKNRLLMYDSDFDGTPMLHAAVKGHAECIKFLLSIGDNVNGYKEHSYSPLLHAVDRGRVECVKILLEASASQKEDIISPMAIAAAKGEIRILKLLLAADSSGIDDLSLSAYPNAHAFDKEYKVTPLIAASYEGKFACMQILLQWGAKMGNYKQLFIEKEKKGSDDEALKILEIFNSSSGSLKQLCFNCILKNQIDTGILPRELIIKIDQWSGKEPEEI